MYTFVHVYIYIHIQLYMRMPYRVLVSFRPIPTSSLFLAQCLPSRFTTRFALFIKSLIILFSVTPKLYRSDIKTSCASISQNCPDLQIIRPKPLVRRNVAKDTDSWLLRHWRSRCQNNICILDLGCDEQTVVLCVSRADACFSCVIICSYICQRRRQCI